MSGYCPTCGYTLCSCPAPSAERVIPPPRNLMNWLHDILTAHGIDSRTQTKLGADLIHWAAEGHRQSAAPVSVPVAERPDWLLSPQEMIDMAPPFGLTGSQPSICPARAVLLGQTVESECKLPTGHDGWHHTPDGHTIWENKEPPVPRAEFVTRNIKVTKQYEMPADAASTDRWDTGTAPTNMAEPWRVERAARMSSTAEPLTQIGGYCTAHGVYGGASCPTCTPAAAPREALKGNDHETVSAVEASTRVRESRDGSMPDVRRDGEQPRSVLAEGLPRMGETERGAGEAERPRTIDELRQALRTVCEVIWNGGKAVPGQHVWSIPVDKERDFDCILGDGITELEALRGAADALRQQLALQKEFTASAEREFIAAKREATRDNDQWAQLAADAVTKARDESRRAAFNAAMRIVGEGGWFHHVQANIENELLLALRQARETDQTP